MRDVKAEVIRRMQNNDPGLNGELNLTCYYLNNEDALKIGAALRTNTYVTKLNLCHNSLSDLGAKCIIAGLNNNCHVTELSLYDPTGDTHFIKNRISPHYEGEARLLSSRNQLIAIMEKGDDILEIKEKLYKLLDEEIIIPFANAAREAKNSGTPVKIPATPFGDLCSNFLSKFCQDFFTHSEELPSLIKEARALLLNPLSRESIHWKTALFSVPKLTYITARFINKLRVNADQQNGEHPFKTDSLLEAKFFKKIGVQGGKTIWQASPLPDECLEKISEDLIAIKSNPQKRKMEKMKNNAQYTVNPVPKSTLWSQNYGLPSDFFDLELSCRTQLENAVIDFEFHYIVHAYNIFFRKLVSFLNQLSLSSEWQSAIEDPIQLWKLIQSQQKFSRYYCIPYSNFSAFSIYEANAKGGPDNKDLICVNKQGECVEMSEETFRNLLWTDFKKLNQFAI